MKSFAEKAGTRDRSAKRSGPVTTNLVSSTVGIYPLIEVMGMHKFDAAREASTIGPFKWSVGQLRRWTTAPAESNHSVFVLSTLRVRETMS